MSRPCSSLVECVADAQLEVPHIVDGGAPISGFTRCGIEQLASNAVARRAVGFDTAAGQRNIGNDATTYAPVGVDQVAYVKDVYAELQRIALAAHGDEKVARNGQVEAVQHRAQATVALGVLAAAAVQVRVVADVFFKESRLLLRGIGNVVHRPGLKEQVRGVYRYEEQVVAHHAVAVHVAGVSVGEAIALNAFVAEGELCGAAAFFAEVGAVAEQADKAVRHVAVGERQV